jgi:cysteate synthase
VSIAEDADILAATTLSGAHYHLRCAGCGARFADDGTMLACPARHAPALLVSQYHTGRLDPDRQAEGMFRYRRWLPATRPLPGTTTRGVTYRGSRLGRAAGLANLWISFNGYWPERGATLPTATFKDLEAHAALSRLPEHHRDRVLVVASAGNTAAAFARACSQLRQPCLIVIPDWAHEQLRPAGALEECVRVVTLCGDVEYSDAIALAEQIVARGGAACFAAGGATNVARRDGVATSLLGAVETTGRIPDYYFQAVGSGAGGIAAAEACGRLAADGRFGERPARLMLSQNLPYVPMVAAWRARRRDTSADGSRAGTQIRRIGAPVLSTRHPAYTPAGGVFDALSATGGDMLAVSNAEATAARRLVEQTEGIDIDPAAAVAAASLLHAARAGRIHRDALVLLNLSGGGRHRLARERRSEAPTPAVRLPHGDATAMEQILNLIG